MDFVTSCGVANNSDVLTTAFSADSTILCAGTGDSTVLQFFAHRLYTPSSVVFNATMTAGEEFKAPPVCIRFLPESLQHRQADEHAAKNMMLVACVDGGLSQWHLSSAKRLQSASFRENPIYAVDYDSYGSAIAGGCDDGTVVMLDPNRIGTVVSHLKPEIEWSWMPHGSQRIQSIKHMDGSLIVSGGWSRSAIIWDTRSGRPVSRMTGPYICGDGIDAHGEKIVTASFREENQLELWDIRNLTEPTSTAFSVPPVPTAEDSKKMAASVLRRGSYHHHPPSPKKIAAPSDAPDVQFDAVDDPEEVQLPSLFTAKFNPSGTCLLAGGNFGQLHYYDVQKGREIQEDDVHFSRGIASAALSTQKHSIFSICWSPDGRGVGVGGGHGLCLGVSV